VNRCHFTFNQRLFSPSFSGHVHSCTTEYIHAALPRYLFLYIHEHFTVTVALDLKHGQGHRYITYHILLLLPPFLWSRFTRIIPSFPHFVAILMSPPISRRALARTAPGSTGLGLGTQVGAERGSVPPYTSLRRFPACVVLKDWCRRRDLPRTLYVRCLFHGSSFISLAGSGVSRPIM
jgi:hypothetical protein